MAYTQVQVIADTNRRHAVKRINSANTETSALVVNAAALAYARVSLNTDASTNTFQIGETVNSSSGGTATVQDIVSSTQVKLVNVVGTFADNDTITGVTTLKTRTQDGSTVPDAYELNILRVLYDVKGSSGNEKVTLSWEGTSGGANNRTIAILSGCGVFEFDTHAVRIPNNANSATGNIVLTTDNWNANAHYTLILDVSKREGYALPNYQRAVS